MARKASAIQIFERLFFGKEGLCTILERARGPEPHSQLWVTSCILLAKQFIFLCLYFLICKLGIITAFIDKVGVRIESANTCKVLSAWHILSIQ